MNKICSKCKKLKEFKDFYKQKSSIKDGYKTRCKICDLEKHREWRQRNKEYDKLSSSKGMLIWRKNNPDRNRHNQLKAIHGISLNDYNSMLEKQNNVCNICFNVEVSVSRYKTVKRLAVDHDHITGEIRGLLCHNCNLGLGNFKDNIQYLINAVDYLKLKKGEVK